MPRVKCSKPGCPKTYDPRLHPSSEGFCPWHASANRRTFERVPEVAPPLVTFDLAQEVARFRRSGAWRLARLRKGAP